jgi:hypothetical protein
MATERHRGRRTAASEQNQSRAEREIREKQAARLAAEEALEEAIVDLATTIAEWQDEGVGTAEIGTWLTSKAKPNGVTRQQVYKLVAERVDGKKMSPTQAKRNGAPGRPRPRPKR